MRLTITPQYQTHAAKEARKIAAHFGYTAHSNPFGDANLHQQFVWKASLCFDLHIHFVYVGCVKVHSRCLLNCRAACGYSLCVVNDSYYSDPLTIHTTAITG
jgi:hypothetical protein